MRSNFILFLAAFFTAYGLVNFYIFIRGWRVFAPKSSLRVCFAVIFLVLALSFIAGRLLENIWLSVVSDVFVWMGAFWIAAMLYLFLSLVLLDLMRLINHWVPFFPSSVKAYPSKAKRTVALVITGSVLFLLGAGHINARIPRIQTLDLSIPKKAEGIETLNIVAASDIHLGSIIGKRRLDSLVAKINALNPDLVLLPGDIMDEDIAPVIKENVGDTLRNLKSRWGVFAVTGNHEYIGGVEEACDYLSDHGVIVLRDQVVKVNESFYLVGREDRSIRRQGKNRKRLQELMAGADQTCPVILMDHQPFQLEEGETNGVDLQISGHTHHGQLWPLNLITERVYELSWGYKKKNSTHVYVSCGFGSWGPPVRIGNRPEIVNLKISFLK